jgi:GntR family transcriptional regulator
VAAQHTYQRIAEEIRDKITRGELRAGDQIPSLPTLKAERRASFQTGQAAFDLLKSWGLVETKPGRGTFVVEEIPVVNWMTEMTLPGPDGTRKRWKDVVGRIGKVGTQRVTGAGRMPAPPDVAHAYGYEAGTEVAWRQRLMISDGRPAQIATSYYSDAVAAAVPALTNPELLPTNAMQLMSHTDFEITGGEDEVMARAATAEEAGLLEVAPSAPVSEVFRTARNAVGDVVTVERMVTYGPRMRHAWKFGTSQA